MSKMSKIIRPTLQAGQAARKHTTFGAFREASGKTNFQTLGIAWKGVREEVERDRGECRARYHWQQSMVMC